jgi:hypothetical protein
MAQIDNGPATGNGVLPMQLPGGPVTTGVEVHVPSGLASLEPSRAPFVDPGSNAFNVNAVQLTPVNNTFVFGTSGATVRFANPA